MFCIQLYLVGQYINFRLSTMFAEQGWHKIATNSEPWQFKVSLACTDCTTVFGGEVSSKTRGCTTYNISRTLPLFLPFWQIKGINSHTNTHKKTHNCGVPSAFLPWLLRDRSFRERVVDAKMIAKNTTVGDVRYAYHRVTHTSISPTDAKKEEHWYRKTVLVALVLTIQSNSCTVCSYKKFIDF